MLLEPERLSGLVVFAARAFPDERGFVLQSWVKENLEQLGIPAHFEQAIQTQSHRGVVRGLHFQWAPRMGKLVRCLHGAVLDVVVDVRHGSPTLGDHAAVELTSRNHRVIWVPPGFAHGTFALDDDTTVLYECSVQHGVGGEGGILWNDPALGIAWPDIPPIVSDKDRVAPTLAAWLADPRSQHFRADRDARV
jgi:dTDP-4-dehydrorhamnose 3,5-epimerase